MREIFEIPLNSISTKEGVIRAVDAAFLRRSWPTPGWDGFNDDLRSLDTDCPRWIECVKKNPQLDSLHLVITGARLFRETCPRDYNIFCSIIDDLTDPQNRYDDVTFSYEIHD